VIFAPYKKIKILPLNFKKCCKHVENTPRFPKQKVKIATFCKDKESKELKHTVLYSGPRFIIFL